MAKELHEAQVLTVKQAIASGEYPSVSAIARELGLDRTLVSRIANGERWAHVDLEGRPGVVGFTAMLDGAKKPRVQRGGRKLSDDEARYARRHLLHRTKTMRELAEELGVSIDVIRGIKEGRTYRDVQAYDGVPVEGRVGNTREKLTPEQKQEIVERVGERGETQTSVARSLGISLQTLNYFWLKHRRAAEPTFA